MLLYTHETVVNDAMPSGSSIAELAESVSSPSTSIDVDMNHEKPISLKMLQVNRIMTTGIKEELHDEEYYDITESSSSFMYRTSESLSPYIYSTTESSSTFMDRTAVIPPFFVNDDTNSSSVCVDETAEISSTLIDKTAENLSVVVDGAVESSSFLANGTTESLPFIANGTEESLAPIVDKTESATVDIVENESYNNTTKPPILPKPKRKSPSASNSRRPTAYYNLKKKLLCASGKVTRTLLGRSSKATQNAFYSVTNKSTAFKAVQFSAKYWKNPIYTTNIPINISEGAIPYSHVDKMRPIEPYDGNIHTLTTELGNEVFSETTTANYLNLTTLLSNYLESDSLLKANNVSDGIDTSTLSESLHIQKRSESVPESVITQLIPLFCYPSVITTDKRIVQLETLLNAHSLNPIKKVSAEPATPAEPNCLGNEISTTPGLVSILKRKLDRDTNDNKENVSSKRRKKDNDEKPKTARKKNGTLDISGKKDKKVVKRVQFDLTPKLLKPRNSPKEIYKVRSPLPAVRNTVPGVRSPLHGVKNSVRPKFQDEIRGEQATDLDLEYLKARKLSIKTARGKPSHNFGVFCEEGWLRQQLVLCKRDLPIPLPIHEPVKNKNGKLNRKRRFDPYTQEKAAQYAYAHIPIPENHSAYPLLPTLHAFHSSGASNDGARLLLDEYSALEEEFKNSLLKSHKLCSQKEEFHWKEYLPHNLARDNADLLDIHKRIDCLIVQKIKLAATNSDVQIKSDDHFI